MGLKKGCKTYKNAVKWQINLMQCELEMQNVFNGYH